MLAKNSLKGLSALIGIVVLGLAASHSSAFAFGEKAESQASASSAGDSGADAVLSSGDTVWVTRPDGAQQCAPESGQSLGGSAAELKKAKVHVLNSQKGNDGKLHAQMCGIPSGKTNMFQIPRSDLPKAIVLGFHQVKN